MPDIEAQINGQKRVFGNIVVEPSGRKTFVDIDGKTTQLPADVKVPEIPTALRLETTGNGPAKIIEQRDLAAAALDRNAPSIKVKPESEGVLKRLHKNMDELEKLFEPLLAHSPGRGPASTATPSRPDRKLVTPRMAEAIRDTQQLYQESKVMEDRTRLARVYLNLQEQQKAYYGSRDADNYPPSTYQEIYNAALSACKVIIDNGDTEVATTSGSLIGKNIVLTCAHGGVKDAEKLTVEFPSASDPTKKSQRLAKRIPNGVGTPRNDSERALDYCLLEIENDPNDTANRIPMVLTRRRPALDTAVYALGHPNGGPLEVHDFSRVVMPYRIKDTDRDGFLIRIHADLLRQNILSNANLETAPVAEEEFARIYKSEPPYFIYRNQYLNSNVPVFGVDTDTFTGDSGCPILVRKTGRLCGILIEGMAEKAFFHSPTIRAHERCVPMELIIEQLDQKMPGWATTYHVSINDGIP